MFQVKVIVLLRSILHLITAWLDPSTVRVVYTLTNDDGMHCIMNSWRSLAASFVVVRCIVGGAITDDIDQYNRVHEILNILSCKANRDNDIGRWIWT
jgi:hypothetical protein